MTARHCVVLAGGLGTRIRAVTQGLIPKVLVPVLGKPFLQYKLEGLRTMGVKEVTMLVGELGHMIDDFVNDLRIDGLVCQTVHDGPNLLGTAGSIARALPVLPDNFWVTYGDSYVVADLAEAERRRNSLGVSSIMTVLHNHDQWETSNTAVDSDLVSHYEKGAIPGTYEWVDYGLLFLNQSSFSGVSAIQATDLHEVLTPLITQRQVLAFEAHERFWDVGTPDALHATEQEFLARGLS